MLLKKNSVQKAKMLRDLNLNRSAFINWEQRGNIPSGETLKKIADYFNVSVDYLLENGQKEKPLTAGGVELNDDEIEFIKALRALSPEEKKLIYRAANIVPRDIDL
jgi:transcriptional regulator with XRE-family HTH domain